MPQVTTLWQLALIFQSHPSIWLKWSKIKEIWPIGSYKKKIKRCLTELWDQNQLLNWRSCSNMRDNIRNWRNSIMLDSITQSTVILLEEGSNLASQGLTQSSIQIEIFHLWSVLGMKVTARKEETLKCKELTDWGFKISMKDLAILWSTTDIQARTISPYLSPCLTDNQSGDKK